MINSVLSRFVNEIIMIKRRWYNISSLSCKTFTELVDSICSFRVGDVDKKINQGGLSETTRKSLADIIRDTNISLQEIESYGLSKGNASNQPLRNNNTLLLASSKPCLPIMESCFSGCNNLVFVSQLDMSNVTSIKNIFENDISLTYIDTSSWTLEKNNNVEKAFYGCERLKGVDLKGFRFDRYTSLASMFYLCKNIDDIKLDDADLSNINNMQSTFQGCQSIKSLDLRSLPVSTGINMTNTFYNCTSLEEIKFGSAIKLSDMQAMFYGCKSLKHIDTLAFDTSNVKNMYNTFYGCSSLESIDLSSFDTSNVTTMRAMFSGCSIEELDVSMLNTQSLTTLQEFITSTNIVDFNINGIDTHNVTIMKSFVQNCKRLKSLDISTSDTSNVKNWASLLYGCTELETVKIGDMSGAAPDGTDSDPCLRTFATCPKITNLEIRVSPKLSFDINCPLLSEQSIRNVINSLYDLSENGTIEIDDYVTLALNRTAGQRLESMSDSDDLFTLADEKGWMINY